MSLELRATNRERKEDEHIVGLSLNMRFNDDDKNIK